MNNLTKLTFETLPQLDGKLSPLLDKHLQAVANDCINRPTDPTARKVVIEFNFTPVADPQTGECDDVDLVVEAKSKVPVFKTRGYRMRVTRGGMGFNADDPAGAPGQGNLFPSPPSKPFSQDTDE
jgi:hypothetical protein